MALLVKQGVFALNTSTGNQTVSGVGFRPKLVIFTTCARTGDGNGGTNRIGFGAMTASAQRSMTWRDQNALSTTSASRYWKNDRAFTMVNNSSTSEDYSASYVSMNADGFTINVDVAPSSAYQVSYIAYGGDDLKNVAVGDLTILPATASTAVTLGHAVTGLILFSALTEVASGTSTSNVRACIGYSDGVRQCCNTIYSENAAADSVCMRYSSSSKVLSKINGVPSVDGESTVAFSATGFTLTHTDQYPSTNNIVMYIAFDGPQCRVGNFQVPGSATTDKVISDTGFKPKSLHTMSIYEYNVADFLGTQLWICLGMSAGASEEYACGGDGYDAQTDSQTNRFSSGSNTVAISDDNHDGSINITLETKSFDAGGFTLTQTLATDTNQAFVFYMAIGDSIKEGRAVGRGILRGVGRGVL